MLPSLANVHASREILDLLVKCWAFGPGDRPDFAQISDVLSNLAWSRSPSPRPPSGRGGYNYQPELLHSLNTLRA